MDPADRARAAALLAEAAWLGGGRRVVADLMLDHGRILELAPGQWAQAEGDDETGVLVVLDGAVQLLCQAAGGREVLIGQATRGVAIGQTARFGGGPRLVTVIAAERSRLLQVSDRALSRIAREAPQVWEAVAALLYLQLRNMLHLVAELAALPPRQRLAARLDLLTRGAPAGGRLRLTQEALGEMVGLTRKTANAHLAAFEREGLIRRDYGGVTVIDAAGLRKVAAS